jgi:hypothetical protein
LQPGEKLEQLIKDFRFSNEQAAKADDQQSPSWMARSLLGDGLKECPSEDKK